ncbi:MAG: hypothetical protein KGI97_08645 [Alphaproteobacteria bacterium]|nr:hypothetical protein [Alphaproteobacteria bacterium]
MNAKSLTLAAMVILAPASAAANDLGFCALQAAQSGMSHIPNSDGAEYIHRESGNHVYVDGYHETPDKGYDIQIGGDKTKTVTIISGIKDFAGKSAAETMLVIDFSHGGAETVLVPGTNATRPMANAASASLRACLKK